MQPPKHALHLQHVLHLKLVGGQWLSYQIEKLLLTGEQCSAAAGVEQVGAHSKAGGTPTTHHTPATTVIQQGGR